MNKWILASRPKTLPAAVSPVILGTAMAYHDGSFHPFIFFMILLAAVLIQTGANFANDVYDFEKGTDREDRLGPARALQSGLISPQLMKSAMWKVFALAMLIGFYLAYIGGWPIVIIGLASIAAGIAYTGGPWPLGYHGLGDLFVFLFFGIIAVSGTYYLYTETVTPIAFWAGSTMGLLSTAILVVNNLRDRGTDVKSGKNTLAVRFGYSFSMMEYAACVILPFTFPLCLWYFWDVGMAVLPTLFTLPVAVHLLVQLRSKTGRELNQVLAGTARFMFVFTLLLSGGLIL
ncbi:MAG: 1,4-dihydroxy-2-naphthoate polyprenyltransferase [Candidatus Marinimicrobia bacterium]|jgi:1,4-dihydroxy-2-naphthoate octaprenyltransferase|nr:1,4-dihydroxy-2-naphthoate polyprenyltransferase [Candidatus Neomarinimicrobiota bacterium]